MQSIRILPDQSVATPGMSRTAVQGVASTTTSLCSTTLGTAPALAFGPIEQRQIGELRIVGIARRERHLVAAVRPGAPEGAADRAGAENANPHGSSSASWGSNARRQPPRPGDMALTPGLRQTAARAGAEQ